MKHLLVLKTAAILTLLPPGAAAQSLPWLDLGIYGGMAATTPWFSVPDWNDRLDADVDLGIATNPVFGAITSYWPSPVFGARAHLGYLPSPVPHTDEVPGFGVFPADAGGSYPLNNYFLDLAAVARPLSTGTADLASSFYLWFGGGLMFTNAADNQSADGDRYGCNPSFTPLGACLPDKPRYATVGQVTTGLGLDVVALTDIVGIFGEVAAHGYDSPVHIDPARGQDDFAWTFRGVAGLRVALWWPEPPVVPIRTVVIAPPPPPVERPIQLCVIEGGTLRNVDAVFRPATGDTLIGGRRFADVHPTIAPTYASGADWFIEQDSLEFDGATWVKFGVSRVIQPGQLQRVGEVIGTAVFVEQGGEPPFEVLYVPTRPGCEFQPYQLRVAIRPRA